MVRNHHLYKSANAPDISLSDVDLNDSTVMLGDSKLSLHALRRTVFLISQSFILFNTSLIEHRILKDLSDLEWNWHGGGPLLITGKDVSAMGLGILVMANPNSCAVVSPMSLPQVISCTVDLVIKGILEAASAIDTAVLTDSETVMAIS